MRTVGKSNWTISLNSPAPRTSAAEVEPYFRRIAFFGRFSLHESSEFDGRAATAHDLLTGFPVAAVEADAELAALMASDELNGGALPRAQRYEPANYPSVTIPTAPAKLRCGKATRPESMPWRTRPTAN